MEGTLADRVFLDANVLFSAAYRVDSKLNRLWQIPGVQLISSAFAIEEARRNLHDAERLTRLDDLISTVEIVPEADPSLPIPSGVNLQSKDVPILAAAIQANATHLITGDKRDFGPYFGTTIAGVLVQPPAEYLQSRPDIGE
jgi:predicted nucleic acid-binding protein